jgi:hypothetical protein
LNPSESVQTINYVQTTETKARVFQIPVIDCRKEQKLPNYKDIDHQRTKALRELTEQRTQQKLFHLIFYILKYSLFCLGQLNNISH